MRGSGNWLSAYVRVDNELIIFMNINEYLVIELKRGRASYSVVGQIQSYMWYIKNNLANENQTVKDNIIALDDDLSIQNALSVTTNIEFYKYKISFELI